ncbi:MAG TPA: YlxR family protein [Micromonosporaceae bacterium]
MVRRASPVRTCVGCRRRAPASELLRVVAVCHAEVIPGMNGHVAEPPGRESGAAVFSVVPDPRHRRPGRGAHLHPDPICFAHAQRRRAFGRALRVSGVLDTGELAEFVAAHGADSPPTRR